MSRQSRRNLRAAAIVAGAVLLEVLCRRNGHSDVDVVRADFGASAAVAAIVSVLSGLFNRFSGKSVDLGTKLAVEGMRSDVSSLGKSLTSMIVQVAGQVASSLGVVRRFIQKVFSKLYDMLAKLVTKIARILDKIFGPIIDFLDKVKFHLKKIYDKVIKPIIDTIEFVRSVLKLLSLFHIDWAKKLDTKLQQLEEYVLAPYELIVAKLNEVSNWINRIVTLNGLLQKVLLLQSLLRDAGAVSNLTFNSALKDRGTGLNPRSPGGVDTIAPETVVRDMRLHFETGNAKYSGVIRESVANVRLMLKRAE